MISRSESCQYKDAIAPLQSTPICAWIHEYVTLNSCDFGTAPKKD